MMPLAAVVSLKSQALSITAFCGSSAGQNKVELFRLTSDLEYRLCCLLERLESLPKIPLTP